MAGVEELVLISGATTATFTPCDRRYVTRLSVVLLTPFTGPNDSVARRTLFPLSSSGKGRLVSVSLGLAMVTGNGIDSSKNLSSITFYLSSILFAAQRDIYRNDSRASS